MNLILRTSACVARLSLLAAALVGSGARGQAPLPGRDEIVELPTVTVTDSRLLPPPESWHYAIVPGFEILTNASDARTQKIVGDLFSFRQALGLVWPAVAASPEAPTRLILCARQNRFAQFVPENTQGSLAGTVSLSLHDREGDVIVVDLATPVLSIAATDDAADAAGVNTVGLTVDYFRQLHREYVHHLLARMEPRPAPWLEEGLAELFMSMEYTRTRIVFGKVADPNRVSAAQGIASTMNALAQSGGPDAPAALPMTAPAEEKDFNAALARRGLMPMERMFGVTRDSPEARNTVNSVWASQCHAFVHLCLYGNQQRYQKAFFEFIARTTREPPTEEIFRQCFKKSYDDMLLIIRGYTQFTAYKSYEFRTPKGMDLPEPPKLALREATEGEAARIKGDALRLAGRSDTAINTMIAAYIRGSRDPEFLAALGLLDRTLAPQKADGERAAIEARSRRFLEAAVKGGTPRARAYSELARLRMAEAAKKQPAGASLGSADFDEILGLLQRARGLPPPLPEVYEAYVDAWRHAPVRPNPENLKSIVEGVRRFPNDLDLVYSDALLHAKLGLDADALALANLGIRFSPDEGGKVRFQLLENTLQGRPAP